jgi:hypothetical protein
MDNPRPVPFPTCLVEKNGSIARFSISGDIPGPGIGDRQLEILARSQRRIALRLILATAMSILPPSGIASRALMARLRIASSSWLASIRAGGRPVGNIEPQLHAGPSERSSRSTMPFDQGAQIDRYRAQILLAGECQQTLGQRGAALGALDGAFDQPLQARIVRQALAQADRGCPSPPSADC